jgi:hypothetical protein
MIPSPELDYGEQGGNVMTSACIRSVVLAALTLAATSALAEDKKPAAPAAPAMAPPKPDPALDQLKNMVGTWKCEGKMNMGGQDMSMKSTAKFAWDLDNFWVVGKFESAKAKGMPQFKGTAYYGYDPATKMYLELMVDNMGGWGRATSKGREGDKEEWTGKAMMMGKEMDIKSTITFKGDKEVQISDVMGAPPEAMTSEMTCKK